MKLKKGVYKAKKRLCFCSSQILTFHGNQRNFTNWQFPKTLRAGSNFRKIDQNLRNWRNLIPSKINSLKVIDLSKFYYQLMFPLFNNLAFLKKSFPQIWWEFFNL